MADLTYPNVVQHRQDGSMYVPTGKSLVVESGGTLDCSAGTFVPAVNAGGTIGASTAAAGSSTSDAGALPAGTASTYPVTAADDTKGVKIDIADQVTGRLLFIGNLVSNKILKIYGPTGAVINGGSADAAYSSASGKGIIIRCLSGSGNTWLAWG